ncbi:MAG: flagellin [Candidatus Poribacteria bacterium]|nr:flagellin [Candidatus Poribacteria bacterium]
MAGFRINTNITALGALRSLNKSQGSLEKSIERLSSGLRINRAKDDTAGMAISQRMRAEIGGLQQASRNASQSVNLIQTAEGGLNEIHSLLTRMRDLAVEAASDNVRNVDRAGIDLEFNQLRNEISRIATSTEYNSTKLINGSFTGNSVSFGSSNTSQTLTANGVQKITLSGTSAGTYTVSDASSSDGAISLSDGTTTQTVTFTTAPASGQTSRVNFSAMGVELTLNDAYDDGDLDGATFEVVAGSGGELQIGADNASDNQLTFSIGDSSASGLSLEGDSLANISNARSAIDTIDAAIDLVSDERGTLGALQNRLEFTISNLDNISQNIQAAESTIRDADFAAETAAFTRAQILVQSGTAMLAQANSVSSNVLSLLG